MPYYPQVRGMSGSQGAGGVMRNRITQALLDIQNPQPTNQMPQQQGQVMPQAQSAAPGTPSQSLGSGNVAAMTQPNVSANPLTQQGGAMSQPFNSQLAGAQLPQALPQQNLTTQTV